MSSPETISVAAIDEFIRKLRQNSGGMTGQANRVYLLRLLRDSGLPETVEALTELRARRLQEEQQALVEQRALADTNRREDEERRGREADERRRQDEWELAKRRQELEVERLQLENERMRTTSTPTSSDFVGDDSAGFDTFDQNSL